ncbi:MAG: hypothetical protein HRU11_03125 [Parvularculaceae bacterium]|nr:hypothetical protein [Parvularculaceae bacterium]
MTTFSHYTVDELYRWCSIALEMIHEHEQGIADGFAELRQSNYQQTLTILTEALRNGDRNGLWSIARGFKEAVNGETPLCSQINDRLRNKFGARAVLFDEHPPVT